jgi:hypothetical protein
MLLKIMGEEMADEELKTKSKKNKLKSRQTVEKLKKLYS